MLKKATSILSTVLALFLLMDLGMAQQPPAYTPPPNPSTGENLIQALGRTSYEFWLTCIISTVGIIIILLLIFFINRVKGSRAEDISRPVIVVTVIFSTLILVTAGYSNEQIAPAFGLFGTIIGYILGRRDRSDAETPPAAGQADQPPR
jgi:hypothetical protein